MVSQLPKPEVIGDSKQIYYPDCDDQPMASNTEQYRWLVTIQQNLDWLLPDAFVAGDLFWYPVEGRPDIVVAPDVMLALGRPKGVRPSYKQWQEAGIAPQVVFEILSPSNTRREMGDKLLFFNQYGVEEYYIYDTQTKELDGYLRGEMGLTSVANMSNFTSSLLGIRFDMSGSELQLFYPDGRPFLTFQELLQRAESAEERAESAEERAAQLERKLRELGVDPSEI